MAAARLVSHPAVELGSPGGCPARHLRGGPRGDWGKYVAVTQPSELERELQLLEVRKLESEYNLFFSGRLPKPPWESRGAGATAAFISV
jgi:hypothetical protein